VTLSNETEIYGGLDCTVMEKNGRRFLEYTGMKSTLAGEADKAALMIKSGADWTKITDFTITGASAMTESGSSIAVVVENAIVKLSRCDVVAGNAMDGADGNPYPTRAPEGKDGGHGGDACTADPVVGGIGPTTICMNNNGSVGGDGGNGKSGFCSKGSDG